MKFTPANVRDAWIVDIEPRSDERGFFARTMCSDEFARHGLKSNFVQQNVSTSAERGTIRGMHYQLPPHSEVKLVRCVRGAILDVIIDLRSDSPTFMQHAAVELAAETYRMLYVPEGFAHGFQTLTDDIEVTYLVTAAYAPNAERGVRYNDPAFGIDWPLPVSSISPKDASWPLVSQGQDGFMQ